MLSSSEAGRQSQLRRVLGRAMRRECPSCGQGGIFTSWLSTVDRCPRCNWFFERGDGYFIGATCVNLVIAEVIPFAWFIVTLVITWPHANWNVAGLGAIVLAIGMPILCYPWARMIWLAVDLVIRPIQPEEYARPHALD
ncbi:MAG TPA: hypothetical protein VFS62_14480 [Chloroflexota bacterium]|nr:hypothetical protein [Chloroflexota bacterium]